MASSAKSLFPPYRFKIWSGKSRRAVAKLPKPYQAFYGEWKEEEATPVHWIPRKVNWERVPRTGEVKRVQDRPIPVLYPHQMHEGLWGGEGVVDGKVKKRKYQVPVPRFWTPNLQKTVVYSEILDKYFSLIVTERALRLIDEHHGLDAYLLKNPAYELKSMLALKLKKKLLLALVQKDFAPNDPQKQEELLTKYKDYLKTMEELEWYGLTISEAQAKYNAQLEAAKKSSIVPLKHKFRQELIAKLKEQELLASQKPDEGAGSTEHLAGVTNWLSNLNPFTKPAGVDEKSSKL